MKIRHYIASLDLFLGLFCAKKTQLQAQTLKPIISEKRLSSDTSVAGMDGPHIYYTGRGPEKIIKYITEGGRENMKITSKWYYSGVKRGKKLRTQVGHKHFFSFRLKKELIKEPTVYEVPEKLIAVSDIEGEFEAFRSFLIANGVMNEKYKWAFGKEHLVAIDDFFDRGLMVTQTLWLIYHLESRVERAGGKVYFILDNHDLMNMNNDFRYVHKGYFTNAELMNIPYIGLYKPKTELGQWLEARNIAEKIGDYVFVHAGISKGVADLNLSVQELNSKVRRYYFRNKETQQ